MFELASPDTLLSSTSFINPMATTLCIPAEGSDRNPLSLSGGYPQYQPYAITSLSDSNEIIVLLFSRKASIDWGQFKSSVAYHLRAKDGDIEDLKGLLGGEDGMVSASHFTKVLKWFSPLVPEVDLRSSAGSTSSFVWRISSIAALTRNEWFHGFAPDVNKRLKNSPAGTFLVRFGCQAPHFILSMKDGNFDTVVEWRVLYMSGCVRLVESERFSSLQLLIDNYSDNVPSGASSTLVLACDRHNVFR